MPNWGKVVEPRKGIMLHYDGSASDPGAVAWLTHDPACKVSYNWLVLDDGTLVEVAPASARAYHAGKCRPSDAARLPYKYANSAFYGIAIAARPGEPATEAALATVVRLCRSLVQSHGWHGESWRIVGHDSECWPRGRKVDPTGPDPAAPVLSVDVVRRAL